MACYRQHPECFITLLKVAEEASGRGKCQVSSEQFQKGEWKLGLTSHSATKWINLEAAPQVLQPVQAVIDHLNPTLIAEFDRLPEEAKERLIDRLSAHSSPSMSPTLAASDEPLPTDGASKKSKGKVSWKFGGRLFEGELIPSKETATHCFARTHKGNIKTLAKGKSYWQFV